MAKVILINNTTAGTSRYFAGGELDTVSDAALIAKLQSAGGVLLAKELPAVASALEIANATRKRGGGAVDEMVFSDVFSAALASRNAVQKLAMTMVAGVIAVAAGITVSANTIAIATLRTPGGTMGDRVKVALVAGGPGTGSVTLTAVDTAGATVATDTSTYDVALLG